MSRREFFQEILPIHGQRYREVHKRIVDWLGTASGPYDTHHSWDAATDGLPVLRPLPLIADDIHTCFPGTIDPRTHTVSTHTYVVGIPRDAVECVLYLDLDSQRIPRAVLILPDGTFYDVMVRVPRIALQSGGSIVHGFVEYASNTFTAVDYIVFRGRHVSIGAMSAYGDRLQWMVGPVGLRPNRLSHMDSKEHDGVLTDPWTNLTLEPLTSDNVNRSATDTESSLLRTMARRPPTFLRRPELRDLEELQLNIVIVQASIFPQLPSQDDHLQRAERVWLRSDLDYSLCSPLLYGLPSRPPPLRESVMHAAASTITNGKGNRWTSKFNALGKIMDDTPSWLPPIHRMEHGYVLQPHPRYGFFEIPVHLRDTAFRFYARPSIMDASRWDLFPCNDLTSSYGQVQMPSRTLSKSSSAVGGSSTTTIHSASSTLAPSSSSTILVQMQCRIRNTSSSSLAAHQGDQDGKDNDDDDDDDEHAYDNSDSKIDHGLLHGSPVSFAHMMVPVSTVEFEPVSLHCPPPKHAEWIDPSSVTVSKMPFTTLDTIYTYERRMRSYNQGIDANRLAAIFKLIQQQNVRVSLLSERQLRQLVKWVPALDAPESVMIKPDVEP